MLSSHPIETIRDVQVDLKELRLHAIRPAFLSTA
jgi:hypothetical protein